MRNWIHESREKLVQPNHDKYKFCVKKYVPFWALNLSHESTELIIFCCSQLSKYPVYDSHHGEKN